MTNKTSDLRERLNHELVLDTLHGGHDLRATQVFFENGKFSIRGLRIKRNIDITNLFLERHLGKIDDVRCIDFFSCIFEKDVFIRCSVDSINIKECSFESKLYINKQTAQNTAIMELEEVSIENTDCKGNFKLHNCKIESFIIKDTDFLSKADFFKSTIISGAQNGKIKFSTINFEKMALFGEVTFESFVEFKYVTFMGYVHFKNAFFKNGVNLDYSNIEKEINFYNVKGLGSKASKKQTSQETYRIIKHQLKSVGNIIDSNKFHAFELGKKRKSIKFLSLEYPVFLLHLLSSNHSQNWLLPIFWIILTGMVTAYGLNFIGCCSKHSYIMEVFSYMSIMNTDNCIKNNPFIFLSNKIALGYLYYQFLTVVRKDTRI